MRAPIHRATLRRGAVRAPGSVGPGCPALWRAGQGRRRGRRGRSRCRHCLHAALDHLLKLRDQILIVAFRLCLGGLKPAENLLDAVDAAQDQRHRLRRDRHSVTEFAHQGLAGMGQRFEARQAQETAGSLDGMNETENVIEDLGVVRILFEPHQLIVNGVQAFAGLRQKLSQQIIHEIGLPPSGVRRRHAHSEFGQLLWKAFNIG